jgi:hypothetical protein
MFFPKLKSRINRGSDEARHKLPDCPGRQEPSCAGAVDMHPETTSSNAMKALPRFNRKDVIRAAALVAVFAFPLIANAQLGPLRPVKTSNGVSPAAAAVEKAVSRDPCAAEHWPFFSKECLRGSTEAIPRLVSMSAGSPPNPEDVSKRAGTNDPAQRSARIAASKKTAKPRVATHRRERSNISVNYAVNSGMGQTSTAGW